MIFSLEKNFLFFVFILLSIYHFIFINITFTVTYTYVNNIYRFLNPASENQSLLFHLLYLLR